MTHAIPTFETERLLLKALQMSDAPSIRKHFVDFEVISELSHGVPWPYPENGEIDFVNRVLAQQGNNRWVWGIFLKTNPSELIGCVDLWRPGRPENRGFWLGKKFWGQGIMTEAVAPVTKFAFEVLGFEKLVFSNALGNTRSRRVKERAGAVFIGTEEARFVNPNYTHRELWELTKADYEKSLRKKP